MRVPRFLLPIALALVERFVPRRELATADAVARWAEQAADDVATIIATGSMDGAQPAAMLDVWRVNFWMRARGYAVSSGAVKVGEDIAWPILREAGLARLDAQAAAYRRDHR
jgi:hypothetical protein